MENQVENLHQLVSQNESEGQHDLAVELCKETLDDLKQTKGKDHPDVLKVLDVLEQVFLNQIEYNELKFGQNNHKVAVTLTKLGDFYYEFYRFKDAESVYHRALKITEKIFKKNDPEIEKLLWRLAYAYRHQEKYEIAELYLKDSLMICERMGPLEKAKRTLDLGNLYLQKGDLKQAEETYNEALTIFIQNLQHRDLIIGHTKYDMGKCFAKQKRFQEAEKYFKEASFIYESQREDSHLGDAHLGMGCCFLDQGKYEESTKNLQSALTLLTKPPQDPKVLKVADIHFNLGLCFSERKQNKKAVSAYSHAVDIYTEKLGENNLQLAEPMFNLANCLMARGQHKKAEEYLLRLVTLHNKNPIIGQLKAEDTKCCLVKCLTKQGRYQKANKILKEAAIIQETLHLATIKFDLGNSFLDAGNYKESVKLYQEALRIFEKQKNRNDLMVADIKYNLAQGLTQLNRIEEAKGFYLNALSIYTKKLKPDDTHLCDVKMNLANCYLKLEQWQEAQENYLESQRNCKSGSGKHDDVEVKNLIALCFYKQERFKEALDYYSMVLEIYKNRLGADDSDVAEAKANLALCFFKQDCFEEALKYFQETLNFYEGNSATEETIIAHIKFKIAFCLQNQGNIDGAVDYYKEALTFYKRKPISLELAHSERELGIQYSRLEKFDEAEVSFQECIEHYKMLPGDGNLHLAVALTHLGDCFETLTKYKAAEGSFREALEIYEKHPEETDEMTIANVKYNIGNSLFEMGDRNGAMQYYEEILIVYEGRPTSINLAIVKKLLGDCHLEQGKFNKAVPFYKESMKVWKTLPGDMEMHIANIFELLYTCFYEQGQYKDAEDSMKEALAIYEKEEHRGEIDEVKLANMKFNVGWSLTKQGDHQGAVQYFEAAVIVYEKGPISLDLASTKYLLGNEYWRLEKWDVAEKCYKECLKFYRSLPGDRDQHLGDALSSLGKCFMKQSQYKDAEGSFRAALDLFEKHPEETDELTRADIKCNIAECLSEQGNTNGAVDYYESASKVYEKRPISLQLARLKSNLGIEYSRLGMLDMAGKCYKESGELYKSLPGDVNLHGAEELTKLGHCLKEQGKLEDAKESSGDKKVGVLQKIDRESRRFIKKL